MTVRCEIEDVDEWQPLLVVLNKSLMALPKDIAPPERLGCPAHPLFNPRCNMCWLNYQPYNFYRLFRMWMEGNELVFRIPIGGVILVLLRFKENLRPKAYDSLRGYLIEKYPPSSIMKFDPVEFPVELYPYQIQAIHQSIRYRRCIISSPPGSGKTEIGSALIASLPKNWRVGWLTHTRTLLRQSMMRLNRNLGEEIGLISGEDDFNPRRVTVAMVQTLTRRGQQQNDPNIIGWLRSLDAVVMDECHHAPAKTFYWTLMSCTSAWVRFGLTATPMREESEEELYLWTAFSPLIVEIKPEELVEVGRLVPIHLVVYDLGDVLSQRRFSSWQEEYMEYIVRNKVRNYLIVAEAIVYRPAVILVWSIEHIHILEFILREVSGRFKIPIRWGVMYGETPSQYRAALIEEFERGKLDILIISDVGKEGLNIINLRTLIVAAGQKSKVAAIQRVGRGMRPKKWGYVRVVDFYDSSAVTRRHSFRRVRIYLQQLPVIKVERKRAEDGIEELSKALRELAENYSD